MVNKKNSVKMAVSLLGATGIIFLGQLSAPQRHGAGMQTRHTTRVVGAVRQIEKSWKNDLRYMLSHGIITQEQYNEITAETVLVHEDDWVRDLRAQASQGNISREQFDEFLSDAMGMGYENQVTTEQTSQAAVNPVNPTNPVVSADQQQDCVICLSGMAAPESYRLPCNHSFHKSCIRVWAAKECKNKRNSGGTTTASCPLCRAQFDTSRLNSR